MIHQKANVQTEDTCPLLLAPSSSPSLNYIPSHSVCQLVTGLGSLYHLPSQLEINRIKHKYNMSMILELQRGATSYQQLWS